MKISHLLIALVLLLAAGSIFYIRYQEQTTDPVWRGQMEVQFESLLMTDARINEQALRSRYSLSSNYDELAQLSQRLKGDLERIDQLLMARGVVTPQLETATKALRSSVVNKEDVLENFKSHNSLLRNSIRHAPAVGDELTAVVAIEQPDSAQRIESTVNALLSYALLGEAEDAEQLRTNVAQLNGLEQQVVEDSRSMVLEFINHANTVLREKQTTDAYLSSLLQVPTVDRAIALKDAFSGYIAQQSRGQNNIHYLIIGYLSVLGLALIYLGLRLRGTYQLLDQKVQERTAEIENAYHELQQSQEQLIQSEKMASLGQMVAGVAHEINTPLGYVNNNMDVVRLDLGELDSLLGGLGEISAAMSAKNPDRQQIVNLLREVVKEYRRIHKREVFDEIRSLLKDSQYGLGEIGELVSNLRDFSRVDGAEAVRFDVHKGLDTTLKVCKTVLGDMEVVKDYSELPQIECSPSKINQVFMNIINNAAQATAGKGKLIILTSSADSGHIEIVFKDNGPGIEQAHLNKIFDPFFTTKDIGEGTGLGLSIAYKIVRSHGGNLVVVSEPGHGAEFRVLLPVTQRVGAALKVVEG
ncbi:MAG: hypothetical protein Tsb002_18900 [Wenzhouxiangellaceae bacterium]